MAEQTTNENWPQWSKPLTHCYESRHEIIQELAYQHWEKRGRLFGSPEIDWFAAEDALRSYLLASGLQLGPGENLYRRIRVRPNSSLVRTDSNRIPTLLVEDSTADRHQFPRNDRRKYGISSLARHAQMLDGCSLRMLAVQPVLAIQLNQDVASRFKPP